MGVGVYNKRNGKLGTMGIYANKVKGRGNFNYLPCHNWENTWVTLRCGDIGDFRVFLMRENDA